MKIKPVKVSDIIKIFSGKIIRGSGSDVITEINGCDIKGAIYFAFNNDHSNKNGYIVASKDIGANAEKLILVENPRLAFAKFLNHLSTPQNLAYGIHKTAIIHESVKIDPDSIIGPNVVIEENVTIAKNCHIGANSVIGRNTKISCGVKIKANVTIYANTVIGESSIIHAGAVIGSDGFGYEQESEKTWLKISHMGNVVLGKNVEIGASTTIDRGTLASTIIGDGSKIDNQCQIGHNVSIGKNVIISGCTGVAGSTTIQDNVIIGGKVAISDHLFIASGVIIQGASSVVRNIEKPGIYSSVNTVLPAKSWKKCLVLLHSLPKLYNLVKKLESKIGS